MAINVSVQHNGGFLPGIILLTQCYYHRVTRLNAVKRFCICSWPMIPPKRFDIFPPDWGMLRSRRVQIFVIFTMGEGSRRVNPMWKKSCSHVLRCFYQTKRFGSSLPPPPRYCMCMDTLYIFYELPSPAVWNGYFCAGPLLIL